MPVKGGGEVRRRPGVQPILFHLKKRPAKNIGKALLMGRQSLDKSKQGKKRRDQEEGLKKKKKS